MYLINVFRGGGGNASRVDTRLRLCSEEETDGAGMDAIARMSSRWREFLFRETPPLSGRGDFLLLNRRAKTRQRHVESRVKRFGKYV